MTEKIIDIANRFLAEKECSSKELYAFKRWISDPDNYSEVENWLSEHWISSPETDSNTLIENVLKQIQYFEHTHYRKSGFSMKRILKVYQSVAAFLLIPLIATGILLWISHSGQLTEQFTETISPRGQKSQIVLADGTKVWLNSDTKIKYPGSFSKDQRDVYLDGEAFFEVARNTHQPFVVHTSGINVKVLGTKFNVKAYPDENQIETSLFEGKVNVIVNKAISGSKVETEVKSGQSITYSKTNNQLVESRFPREEIDGWKKNQLIFKDDTFNNLVRKVERWYNVDVVYDESQFNDRQLTVELYEGERLDRLMNIISLALSVDYKYEKGVVILTPKDKNM